MSKPCKECPWIVRNKHNDSIVNHSKRLNKKHNCHMRLKEVNSLWDVKEECQCVGNKKYFNNK